jgi:hypothetical protein
MRSSRRPPSRLDAHTGCRLVKRGLDSTFIVRLNGNRTLAGGPEQNDAKAPMGSLRHATLLDSAMRVPRQSAAAFCQVAKLPAFADCCPDGQGVDVAAGDFERILLGGTTSQEEQWRTSCLRSCVKRWAPPWWLPWQRVFDNWLGQPRTDLSSPQSTPPPINLPAARPTGGSNRLQSPRCIQRLCAQGEAERRGLGSRKRRGRRRCSDPECARRRRRSFDAHTLEASMRLKPSRTSQTLATKCLISKATMTNDSPTTKRTPDSSSRRCGGR